MRIISFASIYEKYISQTVLVMRRRLAFPDILSHETFSGTLSHIVSWHSRREANIRLTKYHVIIQTLYVFETHYQIRLWSNNRRATPLNFISRKAIMATYFRRWDEDEIWTKFARLHKAGFMHPFTPVHNFVLCHLVQPPRSSPPPLRVLSSVDVEQYGWRWLTDVQLRSLTSLLPFLYTREPPRLVSSHFRARARRAALQARE